MKKTIDLPDNTIAMTASVLLDNGSYFSLDINCFGPSELQSGEILQWIDEKEDDSDA